LRRRTGDEPRKINRKTSGVCEKPDSKSKPAAWFSKRCNASYGAKAVAAAARSSRKTSLRRACRNQGAAHDSRDLFGSILHEIHGKKPETLLERPVQRNTTRNPSPAAAPAGKAKKKDTESSAMRESAKPLRHTARELKTKNRRSGGALSSGGAILCENERSGRLAVAAQIERQGHWNPSAACKDPTGPGLGAHKEGTKASTAREKILQEKKFRPAIWTKIKAKNSQKKFSDLVST
jgi:hypothetical protein